MEMKNEQKIKGDNNLQTNITVSGDLNIGLQRNDVINLIKEFCFTDKNQIIDIVKEAIESIDASNRKMPDKRIFVPIIQQLSYSLDDEYVKQVYKNLLKSSMEKSKTIHPSFVSIIGQLNSDEIKILNNLSLFTIHPIPLINVRMKFDNKDQQGNGIMLIRYFSDIGYGICENPENICTYLENMERLKLIEIPPLMTLVDKSNYKHLKEHPAVINIINQNANIENIKYEYDELFFQLTNFGLQFINACKE